MICFFRLLCFVIILQFAAVSDSFAHGGVAFEEDRCVINIDFLTAHFTIYQPQESGSEEFCEDIPSVSETIFVMEYLHDFLREMPLDFRIIRDTQDFGIYARWEDVQTIQDLDAVTAYYAPAQIRPDGELTVEYAFADKGRYIGIVTALHPRESTLYHAVFYFQVGGPDYGSFPIFFAIAAALQGAYWVGSGGLARRRARRAAAKPENNNND